MTRRKQILQLLLERQYTAFDLAEKFREKEKLILEDLRHIKKSLRHRKEKLVIFPAACIECGFVFGKEDIKNPSRCPRCRSERIEEQLYEVK